jgi:transcriptional regulator with XRE-family HTH domain
MSKEHTQKSFRVNVKFHNARLKRRREKLGLSTKEMAAKVGLSYGLYLGFENLGVSPIENTGDWKPSALKIAGFWLEKPDYLWPDDVLEIRRRKGHLKVGKDEVRAFLSGDGPQGEPLLLAENLDGG